MNFVLNKTKQTKIILTDDLKKKYRKLHKQYVN